MSSIYLIDDHAMMRDGLRALLEDAGHLIVGETGDVTNGLAEVARLEPDVTLLDLHLDGRSGFELLVELQRRDLPTRVIVLTMSDHPRNVAEALRMGATGYLLKGSAGSELLAAVEAVGAGRRYLSTGLSDIAVEGLVSPAAKDKAGTLSPRERQILVMVARGKSSAAIGEELHLSPKTVDTYRSRLMAKLDLGDVPAIVRWAIREGLIDLED